MSRFHRALEVGCSGGGRCVVLVPPGPNRAIIRTPVGVWPEQPVGRSVTVAVPELTTRRLILYAPCEERAVWLMNDDFIHSSFTLKFDDEPLQLDDPKSSTLLRY